jgi:gamma-aminobutyric acid receptor subunit beta
MAKRIQMRKQRFMAIQKIAEQKKIQVEGGQQGQGGVGGQGGGGTGPPSEHGHSHGHGHSHQHPHAPKQMGMGNRPPGGMSTLQGGNRGCSIVGPLFQEVRFKVHDPKAHSKGGTLENTINGGRGGAPPAPPRGEGGDEEGGGGGERTAGSGSGAAPQHLIHPGKVSDS